MKSFFNCLQEADKNQDVPPLLARPEQEDPTKTAHTVSTTRRKILADAGMDQSYLDALAQRRLEHPEIGRTFYLPSITRKDLDRAIAVKYGPRGSYPSDSNPKIPETAGGWSEGPNTVRVVKPEWNPIRNFLAHETTHALQDPELFQRVDSNIRVAGPMPGDNTDNEQDKKYKNYLFNKAEPAARANEYKIRHAQETGTPLSPNATQKDIENFTDWMWKFSGGKDADVTSDIHFYSTPEGAELLRQAKNEKKPENDEHLAESILINTVMKSFLQYITEAGIRRKQRVLQAHEKNPTGRELRSRFARLDVQHEQNKRTGRVMRRAKAEAEASEPLPTTGGIHAHVERLERVGQKAAGYAGQMADAEKPGFVRARSNPLLSPRGNDGY